MENLLVINVEEEQTRAAYLEGGILTELFIEREGTKSMVGNIYKGKVKNILPGMQAAFIDIGLQKNAFLYVTDAYGDFAEIEGFIGDDETYEPQKTDYEDVSIGDLLRREQEVIVQVAKEPMSAKGARVTTHITIPGRYLVLMPTNNSVKISRRIEDANERNRLKEIINRIKPANLGVIVRTAAEGMGEDEFKVDIDVLRKIWERIQRRAEHSPAPSMLHEDLLLIPRVVRDIFTDEVDMLVIDSKDKFKTIIDFIETVNPLLKNKVDLYEEDAPIFDEYGIEAEIEKALKTRVELKSGGYLYIEQTEALVTIDVNTGKYTGGEDLENTVLKINVESVKEIVRQIRLRNLGGIIIIDFIDMKEKENQEQVINALQEELKKDRARSQIMQLTNLGLIEMTRKRDRRSLLDLLCSYCPACAERGFGKGFVPSVNTVLINIIRMTKTEAKNTPYQNVKVTVHPVVYESIRVNKHFRNLGQLTGKKIALQKDDSLHQEEFKLESY